MIFRMGRKDAESEAEVLTGDLVPDANEPKGNIMAKMLRMGFSREDFVAIMGSHTIGFAREDRSGYKGRWTQNPHVFDNDYFKEVLLGEKTRFLRTPAEIMLYEEHDLKQICE